MEKHAYISPDKIYRWKLSRIWDKSLPRCAWIMLNPSTADEYTDDPTIRRVIRFSREWGYGGVEVFNLFALRATDPKQLRTHPDPTGNGTNDSILLTRCGQPEIGMIVGAWGSMGTLFGRGAQITRMVNYNKPLYCLGVTKNGQPRHPLYLAASTKLVLYGTHH